MSVSVGQRTTTTKKYSGELQGRSPATRPDARFGHYGPPPPQSLGFRSLTLNAYSTPDQTGACVEALSTRATHLQWPPCHEDVATPVSYTHLRAHETRHDLVCR